MSEPNIESRAAPLFTITDVIPKTAYLVYRNSNSKFSQFDV